MTRVVAKLTDADWRKVFQIRCRSKRGEHTSPEDSALTNAAFKEDRKRYAEMEGDVFNETVPFGSTVRWEDRASAKAKRASPRRRK